MAKMKWTKEQESVLNVRNKNVLVSAAAGSGKTAVLVERIIKMVSEDKKDIDRLLIVTFTNAAAAEMRERILLALEKKVRENKDDEHLIKQISYIHNAQITTIDSFCLNVVRQYFASIDIDPSFTIGDTGELKLIKEDVMKELLEDYYTNGDEEFFEFVEDYSDGKSDKVIEELVSNLYKFSMSYPYPNDWLLQIVDQYDFSKEGLNEKEWYKHIIRHLDTVIEEIIYKLSRAVEICDESDGPYHFKNAIETDKKFVENLYKIKEYDERVNLMRDFKVTAFPRGKAPKGISEEQKKRAKSLRDSAKKELENLKEKYYCYSEELILRDIKKCKVHANVLVRLTKDFIERFKEAKKEKNIIDFCDMEHMALSILVEKKDGKYMPTKIAREIAEDIDEIMIDEYQDSNLVQETILNAVSGCVDGNNNVFMVGDVKQSIYKFRLARPELFLEKYNTYAIDDESNTKRITLSKNFRSRNEVLEGTNFIFEKIMTQDIGGIEYDKDNALYLGADYEDYGVSNKVELLMADVDESEKGESEDNKELEAALVAQRIEELVKSKYKVKDKSTGKMRDIKYGDIAILLRGMGSYGEAYNNILTSKGIPVKTPTGTGYFDTFEVETLLNMLLIIDNPRQDIPLVAVMKNIFGFTENELARIKAASKDTDYFYDALMDSEDEKVTSFIAVIVEYREKVTYMSIHDLIEDILKKTGFGHFIASMKAGEIRTANVEMLKEKAVMYENTSYSGLFNFVRYIENLRKYQVEQGEADIVGGGDFVTLMTIHKSKGLEFPVVIVGAMCKNFNTNDERSNVVIHSDLGIGLNYVDRKSGIQAKTLIKESISRCIHDENMAEELRVFYVAMTRAKEKLILSGVGKIEKTFEKYMELREEDDMKVRKSIITGGKSYFEWVVMAMSKSMGSADFVLNIKKPEEIVLEEIKSDILENEEYKSFENWDKDHIYDEKIRKKITDIYEYNYPYINDLSLKGKVSVSDIKHMFMEMFDEEMEKSDRISGFETDDKPLPAFLKEEEIASGTYRGTAYHKIFELLNYNEISTILEKNENLDIDKKLLLEISRQFDAMKEDRLAPMEYFNEGFINKYKFIEFLKSDIGIRIRKAATEGKLFREKQFVIGLPANVIDEKHSKEEIVLVQGIIDAYFEEDGEIVLVDYKTDNISKLEDLKARYKAQMDYYAMALEQITGRKVKEKVLYSVKMCEGYLV